MGNRRLLYFIIWVGFTLSLTQQLHAQDNEIMAINTAIKNNDCTILSNYFQSTISLSVPNLQGNNSKVQARYIMADFFREYPTNKIEEKNRNKMADSSLYCILEYESSDKVFNIYYKLRKEEDSYLISEIKIIERSK